MRWELNPSAGTVDIAIEGTVAIRIRISSVQQQACVYTEVPTAAWEVAGICCKDSAVGVDMGGVVCPNRVSLPRVHRTCPNGELVLTRVYMACPNGELVLICGRAQGYYPTKGERPCYPFVRL